MSKSRRSIANDLGGVNNPNLVRIHDDDSDNDNRRANNNTWNHESGDYLCLLDGLLIKPGSPVARMTDPNKKPHLLLGFLRNPICFMVFFGLSIIMVYFIITCIGSEFVFIEEEEQEQVEGKELPGSSMTTTRTTTTSSMDFVLQRLEINYARGMGGGGGGRDERTFEEEEEEEKKKREYGRVHTRTSWRKPGWDDDDDDGRTFEKVEGNARRVHTRTSRASSGWDDTNAARDHDDDVVVNDDDDDDDDDDGRTFESRNGPFHTPVRDAGRTFEDRNGPFRTPTRSSARDGHGRTFEVGDGHRRVHTRTRSSILDDTLRTFEAGDGHRRVHTGTRSSTLDDTARTLAEERDVHVHTTTKSSSWDDAKRTLEEDEDERFHTMSNPSSPSHAHNSVKYRPCSSTDPTLRRRQRSPNKTNGYLVVSANGGLNQMRNGICDMVAIAMIINATLVIPRLDHNSFWEDTSEFKDIFDVKHFITTLEQYVPVVENLPEALVTQEPTWKAPVSWSKSSYYKKQILPILKERGVVHFSHTDSRLANNDVPTSVQRLRCHACYNALKFTKSIEELGAKLVDRMKLGNQQYIALHLRYEKDMLAFTGCSHGLIDVAVSELRAMRQGVPHWKEKDIDGEKRRLEGGCPLTPREAALLLKALGYARETTWIYIVAGPTFGGHATLTPLRTEFPYLFTHVDLATTSELAPLVEFHNRLAALDYYVALHSNVFIHTFDGNMARAVQGHRRFLGHLKTISPHRKGLVKLVDSLEHGNMTWTMFEIKVRLLHDKRVGAPELRRKGDSPKSEENFYANPYPGCICRYEGS